MASKLALMESAVVTAALAVGVSGMARAADSSTSPATAAENKALRPFHVYVPEADLVDFRRRIAATRWPDKETVADQSQGVQEANPQELVRYWGSRLRVA